MTLDELADELFDLSTEMDNSIDDVEKAATRTQQQIYLLLSKRIRQFDYIEGNLDPEQPLAQRIAKITNEMDAIIGKHYTPRIYEYLSTYDIVDDRTIQLNKSYNELVISKSTLTPARKAVYDQAEYFLVDGVADAYVQPTKYLLMQAVSGGFSLKEANSLLKQWNTGQLTSGKLTSGRPTPRLQSYATQVARDSIYQYNGSINQIIGKEFDLDKFIYQGGLVRDSRPFCKHLVSLRRKIDLDEVPPLLEKYPDGIIPGTTKKNFPIRRGGYNCQHLAMMVRG